MEYKQNVHILISAKKFEELRGLGNKLNLSRSELVREGVDLILRKYRRKENSRGENSNKW